MNTLGAPLMLKALLGLEADLAELRAHALNLGCTFATRELEADVGAFDLLTERFGAVARRLFALQTQVRAIDVEDQGAGIDSTGELVLRAQRLVVEMGLEQLTEAVTAESGGQDSVMTTPLRVLVHRPDGAYDTLGFAPLFVGKLRNIGEVSWFVRGELARIETLWRPYKPSATAAGGRPSMPETTRYVRAVRTALKEMTALGVHRELADILRVGSGSIDWIELRTACSQIASALAIKVIPTLYDGVPAQQAAREKPPCFHS